MKSKSIFLMAVSLGFGLVAAIGITQVMGRNNQPAPTKEEPKLPVLIAVADIDINDILIPEMFTEDEWPAHLVPEGIATTFDELDGMVTTARVGKKGTLLLSNLLEKTKLREKKIPPGFKVIGINLGADDHLNGLLEAGDLVDIMVVSRGARNGNGSSAHTFLRRVTIWSIGSKTKKDIEQNSTAKGSTVVGLLVTEKQSERIVLAQRIADLKLALRGKEDTDIASRSSGTGQSDIYEDGADEANSIAQMFRETVKVAAPVTPAATAMQPKKTFSVVVHTAEGPTTYNFDTESNVLPTKVDGFAGEQPVSAPVEKSLESELDDLLDSDDDDVDADSDSLIDELDSEPGS